MTLRTASCSCGQLQAEVTSDPIGVSVCHCLACQRRTGSVFAAQARFDASAVTVTGASKEYVRVGDEGSRATFRFCPECGATVFYTVEGMEGFVIIPVGAFADPKFPGPTFSVYEERMHSWVSMPPDIRHMD
ncbi:GFA family protein [Ideonella azotifigens]|uniref:GFA family protein n=1 Tax=Ideonella azotifigens TaxID=513160 RepID=A0ABN1K6Z9_9BURK|nr:GFA family protein [Ideonella azotifigens]MCD2342214.1 GFA family protein [Ideonella azotifigens]